MDSTSLSANGSGGKFIGSEERKGVMAPVQEDPLKKREQFAVSLRKEKTKKIISAKRQKLIHRSQAFSASLQPIVSEQQPQIGTRQSAMDEAQRVCFDLSNPDYLGYYKFEDEAYFSALLREISPGFDIDGEPIAQIMKGITDLVHEQTGSLIHQLALISAIRAQFSRTDSPPSLAALQQTSITSILSQIMNFASQEEEVYFLKLEALWMLINLSMCTDDDTLKLMLRSNLSMNAQTWQVPGPPDLEQVNREFNDGRSDILSKLQQMINQSLNADPIDMKVLAMSLFIFVNICSSGAEFTAKVLSETTIVHMLEHILANVLKDNHNEEFMNNLALLARLLVNHSPEAYFSREDECRDDQLVQVTTGLSSALLKQARTHDTLKCALNSLYQITIKDQSLIPKIATRDTVSLVLDNMDVNRPDLMFEALQCLSQFLTHQDENIEIWCFQNGIMPKMLDVLNAGTSEQKVLALFTLSNISSSSSQDIIHSFIEEDTLIERVLSLIQHENIKIKGEALWVITNAVTVSKPIHRVRLALRYKFDLVNPLVIVLRQLESDHSQIMLEVLAALDSLLQLDSEYPDQFKGEDSISFIVGECRGFEEIERLQGDENEEIAQKAMQVYVAHNPGDLSELEKELMPAADQQSAQMDAAQVMNTFNI